MARCYWNDLCDCPNKTPVGSACDTHSGYECSIFRGQPITEAGQVGDVNTAVLEAAIAAMDDDQVRLGAIRARMMALEQDVTQAQTDVGAAQGRMTSGQTDDTERRQIADRMRVITDQAAGWGNELQGFANELGRMAEDQDAVIVRILGLLNRPYAFEEGYCQCYVEKQRRLDRIDNLIRIDIPQLAAERATAKQILMQTEAALAALVMLILILSRLGFAAIISGGWTILLLIGLVLGTVAFIVGNIVRLTYALEAILLTKKRLLKELLWYYRLQMIPECLRNPLALRQRQDEPYASTWDEEFVKDVFGSGASAGSAA